MQYTNSTSLHCAVHTHYLSTLCSTHTVPPYTVQYKHSASLDCVVPKQNLATQCSTHTVPLYTVQYTHSVSLDCAIHTQCLSTVLCSTHTVPLHSTVQYTQAQYCAVHTSTVLCSTHTHNWSQYAAITPTLSMSTDTIEPLL